MASNVIEIPEPSEKEKREIIKVCKEADKIHKFIGSETGKSFIGSWKDDSERFMFFSYFEAKMLNKHSRTLKCWTIVIAVFTVVLGLSTIWSIVDKYLF